MQPTDYGVERQHVNRRVYHSALGAWMLSPGGLVQGMVFALVTGVVWPVTLWLTLSLMVFWAPSMLLEPWQMPMRMPTDMNRPDPSTQRQVPGRWLGFLPVTVMRPVMSKAAGILYLGYPHAGPV